MSKTYPNFHSLKGKKKKKHEEQEETRFITNITNTQKGKIKNPK